MKFTLLIYSFIRLAYTQLFFNFLVYEECKIFVGGTVL